MPVKTRSLTKVTAPAPVPQEVVAPSTATGAVPQEVVAPAPKPKSKSRTLKKTEEQKKDEFHRDFAYYEDYFHCNSSYEDHMYYTIHVLKGTKNQTMTERRQNELEYYKHYFNKNAPEELIWAVNLSKK